MWLEANDVPNQRLIFWKLFRGLTANDSWLCGLWPFGLNRRWRLARCLCESNRARVRVREVEGLVECLVETPRGAKGLLLLLILGGG